MIQRLQFSLKEFYAIQNFICTVSDIQRVSLHLLKDIRNTSIFLRIVE